ncbi:WecB/TagA/CpsF family glycosyltransferase [Lentilactobacillus kisonensis]|uniref:N-acetylglucosaminyldiphosphoundecaprenol N-acetyl-beta-D-mannosaminyltransferase n=2 Tax=Lentilactobacillus kisonensis TaxID=481722 RepID=H1LBR3_9LACO|nr:WecB/TagA/CpsF family glycosyltransferase [Lentilactobacillus kisonensis]EHO54629.1 glycosyltransferase, WecB/TagA/CpsF family [Lentilactobacillus kisonensis F0435]KRL21931.1 glycosyltransferase, WecB TagA CpsF family [Lentilactobacillus kisonensis DSM 19906 = JCM 15041]
MTTQANHQTVSILGIPFINTSQTAFEQILYKRINDQQNTFVVTANPEIVMYAHEHPDYANLIKTADFIVADGIGIVIGAKLLETPVEERITGYDLFESLLKWGDQQHKSAYFVGAKPQVIQKLQEIVRNRYPHLTIAGTHDGYFDDDNQIVNDIRRTSPDMVFVATGYPKQEAFIKKNRDASNALWMGIGGSFDVITGTVKRAPITWQKIHLEWLYRVVKEPARIGRLLVLPKYLLKIIKQRYSKSLTGK